MSSAASSCANSIVTDTQRSESTATGSNVSAPCANTEGRHLFQPEPEEVLAGQYAPLQEYIEHDLGAEASTEDVGLTPRHQSRREGFYWGLQPTVEDQRQPSRNPLGPEQPKAGTPPPFADIIRRMTNEDSNMHNKPFERVDTIILQPTSTNLSTSSTTSESCSRPDGRRASIAAFAKCVVGHVPDIPMFAPPGKEMDKEKLPSRRNSLDAVSTKDDRMNGRTSLVLPSAMKSRKLPELALQPTFVAEAPSEPSVPKPTIQSPLTGSLRDRRKVKLDLSLPTEIPDLPVRNRPPAGALSSTTPSRPRSPKTPWIRNEPPAWEVGKLPKSTPIIEEDHIQKDDVDDDSAGDLGLLPGSDAIFSSQSSRFDHPNSKVRDRSYVSRRRYTRSRSGRSGTSDSIFAQTPDDQQSQADKQVLEEQQAQAALELQELSRNAKTSRLRRWPWRASSEDALKSPELANRRSSINAFKRSIRISSQIGSKEKKTFPSLSRPWFSKQPSDTRLDPTTSFNHMPAPPPFVPPGLQRVPTPPLFDSNGEVKGKLADFFDVHSASAPRKKPPASPGGVWDSDAILMSLSSDINPSDEDEDEGPEGPAILPSPGSLEMRGTPGITMTPSGGYLGVKQHGVNLEVPGNPALGQDSWFRVPHGIETPNERAVIFGDEEERRKFEWLVPEHLPNSPLCPIHPKYRGPCKGVCYWHSRTKVVSGRLSRNKSEDAANERTNIQLGRSWHVNHDQQNISTARTGWEVGMFQTTPPVGEVKKSRFASISGS